MVAAVVSHAPEEKLLQLRLRVRRHHERRGAEVLGFAAHDAPDRVGVDLGFDEVDHRVRANGEQAREEALGDEVLGVLDELLVGGRVLNFFRIFFVFVVEVEMRVRAMGDEKKPKKTMKKQILTCCGKKSTGGAPYTAASCNRGITCTRWSSSPGLDGWFFL